MRLAVLLAVAFAFTVRAAEPGKPGASAKSASPDNQAGLVRPALLVMYVRPKFPELAPASRAARESLMRVLEGLKFRLFSPDDVARLMTTEEQGKVLNDNSTGNLMSLGRKVGAEKVVYTELEKEGKKRIFKLALLPSSMRGPIRFAKAEYADDASDPELDLAVTNALITLFDWDVKK